jgi:2-desacetyl-2-hydroxyethyl bacteriochlorophyllide A dehydrogenase
MKAAVVENFGALAIRDIPEPKPGDGEALCEMLYGSICTGTDSHLIAGHAPFCNWVKLPFILGHESVGRVVKLGRNVRNFKVGDLVTRVGAPATDGMNIGWGGFAQFGIARDDCSVNQVVPAGIDPKVAPMFITWRETLSAILRLGVKAGSSVLVAGSGGNGMAFAVHARNLGASCVVIGSLKRGADVDYQSADYELKPDGFDFIIDAVGKAGMTDRLLPFLRAGGRYLTYGLDDFGSITFNPARARGAFTVMPCSYDEAETHQQVSDAVLVGKLDARVWYDVAHPYSLANIHDAFAALKARQSLKALICLN